MAELSYSQNLLVESVSGKAKTCTDKINELTAILAVI